MANIQASDNKQFSSLLNKYLEDLDYELQHPETPRGLCSGIKDLDKKLDGFRGGEIIIVGGRPAMGKTTFAINCTLNIAKNFEQQAQEKDKKYVLYFSLDDSIYKLIQRFACLGAQIDSYELHNIENSEIFLRLVKFVKNYENLPLYIYDNIHTLQDLLTEVKNFSQNRKVGFIVIDYLTLLRDKNNHTYIEDYSPIVWEIKQLAQKLNAPVLILSQLTRQIEYRAYKEPLLTDMRQYHNTETADKILFLYRELYYQQNREPRAKKGETIDQFTQRTQLWEKRCDDIKNICKIIIAQNKSGLCGSVHCFFDGSTNTMKNLEEDFPILRSIYFDD